MQKDKQVDVGKTSFLELNSMNMSHSSTKETIINELEVLSSSYYKWSLTICDGCFDTLKSSKMQS